ncbi:MAG: NADH-quinone oxidoreductase subunit L [Anaerolineaceae bacterium]
MTPDTIARFLPPWLLIFPLLGMLINLLLGSRLGQKTAGIVATFAAGLAFGVSITLGWLLTQIAGPIDFSIADWITVGSLNFGWVIRVDTLSVAMMLVVTGVGTLIHLYAISYMRHDTQYNGDPGRYRRFFVFFNLFILSMLLLVSADNYLMMFVGWEGVGLCSYLLIGFWFEKGENGIANVKAAKKAFIVNRIGDFGLLIALFLIFARFGTLQFDAVFEQAPALAAAAPGVLLAITLFMLLGVTGKSAQLPLYVWLPDAMAGPTPVSALIHAATMVTAGVYLIARSSTLYSLVPEAQTVVTWVGAATAFFAATIAIGQFDIKKVLAYSTISQLGFMVAAVGMGATVAGMFHLITHAFFKALLFLAAGSVILGMERGHAAGHHGDTEEQPFDPQDMRNMGGLQNRQKTTFWVYIIGALALSGIAPLAGFFSKDEILAASLLHNPAVFVVLLLSAFLTAFYMGRQVFLIFFGKPRTEPASLATESDTVITVPLVILAILATLGGVFNLPGVHWLETWLEPSLTHPLAAEFSLGVAGLSLGMAVAGLLIAWWAYSRRSFVNAEMTDPLARNLGRLFKALQNKWGVDEFYRAVVVKPFDAAAETLANPGELGSIDGVVHDLGKFASLLGKLGSLLQNGFVRRYALMIVVGVALILAYVVLK